MVSYNFILVFIQDSPVFFILFFVFFSGTNKKMISCMEFAIFIGLCRIEEVKKEKKKLA